MDYLHVACRATLQMLGLVSRNVLPMMSNSVELKDVFDSHVQFNARHTCLALNFLMLLCFDQEKHVTH